LKTQVRPLYLIGMNPVSRPADMLRKLNALGDIDNQVRPSLEHLIRSNVATINTVRSNGVSWLQIAHALPNWIQRDGSPASADQLRGAYSRIKRKLAQTAKADLQPVRIDAPLLPKRVTIKAELGPSAATDAARLRARLRKTDTART
jgi:hypothetical protein